MMAYSSYLAWLSTEHTSKTDPYLLKCMSHVSKGTLSHEAASKSHVLIITYSKELWHCYLAIYQFHTDIHVHVFNEEDAFLMYYTQNKKSINLIISVFLCNDLITRQQLYMARSPQPAARRIVNLFSVTLDMFTELCIN